MAAEAGIADEMLLCVSLFSLSHYTHAAGQIYQGTECLSRNLSTDNRASDERNLNTTMLIISLEVNAVTGVFVNDTMTTVCRHLLFVFTVCSLQLFVLFYITYNMLPFKPYSPFYRLTSAEPNAIRKSVLLNKKRVKLATRYFRRQSKEQMNHYYTSIKDRGGVFMSVAIVTINRSHGEAERENLGYLLQSVAALDTFAKSNEFMNKTFLFLCNVDTKPHQHKDAVFLKSYLPFTERYGSSSFHKSDPSLPGSTETYRQKRHNNTYEKETFDYTYCMKVAQTLKPKYILMVEEDAIAHKDLPKVLKHVLENNLAISSERNRKSFAFIKLYYPIKWQGYAFEFLSILELSSVGSVGGGLGVLCLYVFSIKWTKRPSLRTYQCYFLAGIMFMILTAEMMGRQNVLEMRRVSKYLYRFRPSSGCCTQAMLYPDYITHSLMDYLVSSPPYRHTDLTIYDYITMSNVPAFQLEPNLFYHVGMYTSLNKKDKRAEEFLFDV